MSYEKATPRIFLDLDDRRIGHLLRLDGRPPKLHGTQGRQPPLRLPASGFLSDMQLNQVTVPSVNLSLSVKFYVQLGLRLIVDSVPRYARFECPDGGSTFSLHQVSELPLGNGIVIYFECEDLDARVEALQGLGIVFDSLPQDQPWLWREALLKDPDGNAIILYRAGENRRFPPWRIAGETL